MAKDYMARKDGKWVIISIAPDVCKTPVGPSIPPIPYPVIAYLSDAQQVVKNVRANGDPAVVFDQSFVSKTIGDQAGVAKGIKSNTVGAKCYPDEHSQNVKAGKKLILRHNDIFWMNG